MIAQTAPRPTTARQGRLPTRMEVPGERAGALVARDHAVMSRSYAREHPLVIDHARGCEIFDVDGNRYLDFVSGIAVNNTGHCHPAVTAALHAQVDKFLHISSDFYHELWVRLAEKLDDIAPFADPARVFLGNSGTEAVEAAIKLARHHTGRGRFIGFMGAFHGRTMGSLGFTASKVVQRAGFGASGSVTHIPYPNAYRPLLAAGPRDLDYGETVIRYLEQEIFRTVVPADEVAAILVEPIQGEGGYIVPPPSFLPLLRELCDRHGILLIADEVQSGIGRTGMWWAIEHWGVEPDIVCTAKGIASGVPLGGIIARERVTTWPAGAHGNTYGGNPLACAAALATLEVIESGAMDNARSQGDYLMAQLQAMATRHPVIGDVRGKGLMVGVELIHDPLDKTPAVELRNRVKHLAFEHGLLVIGCGVSTLRLIPPLIISRAEIDEALEILEHVLSIAEAELA
jgi:4-aminobutyrate aminotransferase